MRERHFGLLLVIISWAVLFSGCSTPTDGRVSTDARLYDLVEDTWPMGIIGQWEPVVVWPGPMVMEARIDTGATTSSIDAQDIKHFEREGKPWVRFKLVDRKTEEATEVKRKVVRTASITQHGGKADLKRPVVMMTIQMGEIKIKEQFSLADRSSFEYPVLIGRNVLNGRAIVDVGRSNSVPVKVDNQRSSEEDDGQ